MTHFPLYSGKNVYDTEEEIIKRLSLIYDLSEGFYERRGRLDIWDEFLEWDLYLKSVVVVKFTSLYFKNRSYVGLDCPLREPAIPLSSQERALQNLRGR